jgi:hypothetical protein
MINDFNRFLSAVAETELARTARRSAKTVWHAHRSAILTTRREAGKVVGLAIDEGRKLAAGEIERFARGAGMQPAQARARKARRPARRAA